MKRHSKSLDWAISVVAISVVLGIMGTMDREEELISAQVLEDAKSAARADRIDQKQMAALDAHARYITDYELIELAEVRK
ncbi:MAG: hypothetical protein ACEQSE_09310 [Candidatus Aquirickettsiella gammari]